MLWAPWGRTYIGSFLAPYVGHGGYSFFVSPTSGSYYHDFCKLVDDYVCLYSNNVHMYSN
jgi:hypothetical protein